MGQRESDMGRDSRPGPRSIRRGNESDVDADSTGKWELASQVRHVPFDSPLQSSEKPQIINEGSDVTKISWLYGFRRSKPRRFWLSLCALFLLLALATTLSIYLPRSHRQLITPNLTASPGTVAHSYMLDIVNAEDEETRAAVEQASDYVDIRIETESCQI